MNFRHAFHAGNFADVFKHALLARVLLHLREKDTAFRVIDTHAGAGRYDLSGGEAQRTEEWRDGIGKLLTHPPEGDAGALLEPYRSLVRAENVPGEIKSYPGSPTIAAALARPQDRLTLCELHPEEHEALTVAFDRDRRVKVIGTDGWTALKAYLPPPERRGLVLIDPPFEEPGEFQRFEEGLTNAHRRWATGIYLFWYPLKDLQETEAFASRISRLGIAKIVRSELTVAPIEAGAGLSACGMLVVNPPWKLEQELSLILPALVLTLGRNGNGRHHLDWLAR